MGKETPLLAQATLHQPGHCPHPSAAWASPAYMGASLPQSSIQMPKVPLSWQKQVQSSPDCLGESLGIRKCESPAPQVPGRAEPQGRCGRPTERQRDQLTQLPCSLLPGSLGGGWALETQLGRHLLLRTGPQQAAWLRSQTEASHLYPQPCSLQPCSWSARRFHTVILGPIPNQGSLMGPGPLHPPEFAVGRGPFLYLTSLP